MGHRNDTSRIQTKDVPIPTIAAHLKFLRYDNDLNAFIFIGFGELFMQGMTCLGAWTKTDISTLGAGDAEIDNSWAGSATVLISNTMPQAGTVSALGIKLTGDVGAAGNDVTFTVYKNGVATTLTATIAGAAGTEDEAAVTVTPIAFVAGDNLTVQAKKVGAPAAVQAVAVVFGSLTIGSDAVTLTGDVTGDISANTVVKIRNKTVAAPGVTEDGKFLQYDNTNNRFTYATSAATSVTMGGDVSGNSATSTVDKIKNTAVVAPVANDDFEVLTYVNGSTDLEFRTLPFKQVTKSADYVATNDDFVIWVDASAAPRTITLPTAVGNPHKPFVVKKIDATANAVTVDANGAETIDGALTYVMTVQYTSITIVSDNTQWWII